MSIPQFEQMTVDAPKVEDIKAEIDGVLKQISEANDTDSRAAALQAWNELRSRIDTWGALTHLHFSQDTRNEDYKKARDYADEISPKLTEIENSVKKQLLASEHRAELESKFGKQAFAKWEFDQKSFDPKIEEDLVKEAKLSAEYTELKASAKIEFRGETLNLSQIGKYATVADRELREASTRATWGWFEENGAKLDRIYDDLVKVRAGMATKLGLKDFVELGYLRMHRIDYNRNDVENLRKQIVDMIVPLCQKLYDEQAERLGVDKLMFWDNRIFDKQGNPEPKGDHDWMMERAQKMFDEIGHGMGDFFRMMRSHNLLDLKAREGKAGGGFCTSFPLYGTPFIFANFNGTQGDVEVFTHEVGHAFQNYMSRDQKLADYFWPTYESAEIHSMSLEYITWPWMDEFFGKEDGQRFRRVHLAQSLQFLPYGVAVDHFQHLVYENPNATPDERAEMWQQMEKTYLPWRDYGDLPHASKGRMWQAQGHIFASPFYYIDYVLAGVCAMQFWVRSETDRDEAMDSYVKLCKRGGEAPFQELVKGAGLKSPFEDGCLKTVADHATKWLES